jgi:2-polyprenyl-3-methyl-5-hydroxy-6-metoxy-1,4-benzoquinol methylase
VCQTAAKENGMPTDPRADRWLEQSRAQWNERAGFFDELSARNAAGDDRKRELDFITSVMRLHRGSRLLDAGCGPGHFAIAFAERGCIVDGTDLSDEMIERARANAEAAGVSIRFSTGDLGALDAPDDAYDAIVARMVLQFSPHLSAVLEEFERVAAPGARFWLSVPGSLAPMYRDSWKRFVDPEPPSVTYLVPWELLRLIEERGWTVHEQWGSFDSIASLGDDAHNVAAKLDPSTLPLLLQQAAATVWNLVVSPNR